MWYVIIVTLRNFLDQGGAVLWLIAVVSIVMWTLIIYQSFYYKFSIQGVLSAKISASKQQLSAIGCSHLRGVLLDMCKYTIQRGLEIIKILIAICPLLGLLGTVVGMLEVFNMLALTNSSNAQAMADSVSKAIIPTMAGMTSALSGLFAYNLLQSWAQKLIVTAEDQLSQT